MSLVALALLLAPIPVPLAFPDTGMAQRALVRREAEGALQELEAQSTPRTPGFYVAFDPDPRTAYATCACDDDGDEVVVFSDALLVALSYVAAGERMRADFTDVVVRAPSATRLPLPRGFSLDEGASASAAYAGMVRSILLRELGHLRVDRPCANPTATHEEGDERWTRAERDAAFRHGRLAHGAPRAEEVALPPALGRFLTFTAASAYFATFASWNAKARP